MNFSSTVEMSGDAAKIVLVGDFGAEGAHHFHADADWAADNHVGKVVLQMDGVYRISPEGIDALEAVRQRVAADAEIYIVGAIDAVTEAIRAAGLHDGFVFTAGYPPR